MKKFIVLSLAAVSLLAFSTASAQGGSHPKSKKHHYAKAGNKAKNPGAKATKKSK